MSKQVTENGIADGSITTAKVVDENITYKKFASAVNALGNITVKANRRKFISANGKPVFLGTDGSKPTGTPPIVFLSQQRNDTPNTFNINRGTGGDFTITGTLTESTTSPSD